MHKVAAALAVTLVSAIQLAACASRVTSLEQDKTLSDLTAEEQRQYCEDQFHYLSSRVSKDDMRKITCSTAAGAIGSSGADMERARATCQQSYEACTSVPAAEPQSSCEDFSKNVEGCTATVAEASKCAEARADALEELASEADNTCTNLGRAQRSDHDEADVSKTPACERVRVLCPKVLEAQPWSGCER